MYRHFKPSTWSVVATLATFLVFPLPYKGICLAVVGSYCPDWTFLGGFSYLISFFDFIITAFTSRSLPAEPLLQDAISLTPHLLVALATSYFIVHVVRILIRSLFLRNNNTNS